MQRHILKFQVYAACPILARQQHLPQASKHLRDRQLQPPHLEMLKRETLISRDGLISASLLVYGIAILAAFVAYPLDSSSAMRTSSKVATDDVSDVRLVCRTLY
jgi:hypothetical protein